MNRFPYTKPLTLAFLCLFGAVSCSSETDHSRRPGPNGDTDPGDDTFVDLSPPDPHDLCKPRTIPDDTDNSLATRIDACGTLDRADTTYLLTRDVEAPGTCFRVTADGVTLDMGGHRILYGTEEAREYLDGTYGAAFACSVAGIGASGRRNLEIRNGTIEQGAAENPKGHPVHFRGVRGAVIRNIRAIGKSVDTCTLHFMFSDGLRIFDNHLTSEVTEVTNRHYPGQHAIRLGGGADSNEIHRNLIDSGPHWGIYVAKTGAADRVYDNCIAGMRSRHANGYMIAAHTDDIEVFGNYLNSESRGIHVTAENVSVYDNYVEVWERPNAEYPTYWTHGIKLEGCRQARVYRNTVLAKAHADYGQGHALSLTFGAETANEVFQNVFEARSLDETFAAIAIDSLAVAAGNGADIHHNVFRSDHRVFQIPWNGASEMLLRDNVFERTGGRSDFRTIHIGAGGSHPSMGNVLRNTIMEGDLSLYDLSKWHGTTFELAVEWHLHLTVQDAAGNPVEGAQVSVDDGVSMKSGSTDERGKYTTDVTEVILSGEPGSTTIHENRSPCRVLVSHESHGEISHTLTVDEETDLSLAFDG